MRFEFITATQIIFGSGALKEIGMSAAKMGSHGFLLTGRNPERAASLVKQKAIDHRPIARLAHFELFTESVVPVQVRARWGC